MQPKSFDTWLRKSEPGSKIMYHIGLLMKDRQSLGVHGYVKNETHFDGLEVWNAYLSGRVELTQRKRKDGDYEYWATKRRHRSQDRLTDNGRNNPTSQFGYISGSQPLRGAIVRRGNYSPYHNREGEPSAF